MAEKNPLLTGAAPNVQSVLDQIISSVEDQGAAKMDAVKTYLEGCPISYQLGFVDGPTLVLLSAGALLERIGTAVAAKKAGITPMAFAQAVLKAQAKTEGKPSE